MPKPISTLKELANSLAASGQTTTQLATALYAMEQGQPAGYVISDLNDALTLAQSVVARIERARNAAQAQLP